MLQGLHGNPGPTLGPSEASQSEGEQHVRVIVSGPLSCTFVRTVSPLLMVALCPGLMSTRAGYAVHTRLPRPPSIIVVSTGTIHHPLREHFENVLHFVQVHAHQEEAVFVGIAAFYVLIVAWRFQRH